MDESRYYAYSDYLKNLFGGKTHKVVVSSGLTCPTRDGTIAKKGCAFCDVRGSSSFHGKQLRGRSVRAQLESRIAPIQERFGAKHFLAYFQSYSNTYSDVEYLRRIYKEALETPGISGLCVGTRPDCLPDPVLGLLEELAKQAYVSLELGVQSFEDSTLEWLTRGHSGACSLDAFERTRRLAPSVNTCAHLMFGSPTDSPRAGRDAALLLNQAKIQGAKLHQLMVLENTELANRYREAAFPTLSVDGYAEIVVDFIEHLDPTIYIERLFATPSHQDECLAPEWSLNRWDTHNRLKAVFEERSVRQGSRLPIQ